MKKKIVLLSGVVLILLGVIRYRTLNASFPTKVSVLERQLPVTYETDSLHFEVKKISSRLATDPSDPTKKKVLVFADVQILNKTHDPMNLEGILNQLYLYNYSDTFGAIQGPLESKDPSMIVVQPDEELHFKAEYTVNATNMPHQRVCLAVLPKLYAKQYQEKLDQNLLYYEIIPVEVPSDTL